jgi:hypothetical protein
VSKPIVQLFCLLVVLFGRRSERAVQAVRRGGAPAPSDARSGEPIHEGPQPVEQGAYIPPQPWEVPGTIVHPRVAAALPELRGGLR